MSEIKARGTVVRSKVVRGNGDKASVWFGTIFCAAKFGLVECVATTYPEEISVGQEVELSVRDFRCGKFGVQLVGSVEYPEE